MAAAEESYPEIDESVSVLEGDTSPQMDVPTSPELTPEEKRFPDMSWVQKTQFQKL